MQTDPAPSSHVRGILRDAEALRADVSARALTPGSPGIRLFGRGRDEIYAGLELLERRTRVSVWNMQVVLGFDPSSPAPELDARSRRRGIDMRSVVSERALLDNPLVASLDPTALVGPVPMNVLIADSRAVLLPGPSTARAEATVWLATAAPLVDRAIDLWSRVVEVSHPITEPGDPLLTERQIEVARQMCQGARDADIAARLRISLRSTERDVQHVVEHVGARSRAEAVFRLMGGPPAF